jgi:hypothetical protein
VDFFLECRPKLELLEDEVWDSRFMVGDRDIEEELGEDIGVESLGGAEDQSCILPRSWRLEPPRNLDSWDVARIRGLSCC